MTLFFFRFVTEMYGFFYPERELSVACDVEARYYEYRLFHTPH